MTQHPQVTLEGPHDKIERAREHVNALNDKIGEFLDTHPCESVLTESDIETGHHASNLTIRKEPPARWGTIAGEVGYNLRSALDQLVYQLALWNNGTPDDDRTQFPIFDNDSHYYKPRGRRPSWRDSMLKGVSRKHRTTIDRLQPFQHGRMAERTALAMLNTFSNKDKHRVSPKPIISIFGTRLHVIGPGLTSTEIYVPYDGEPKVLKQQGRTHSFHYEFTTPPNVYVNMNAATMKVGVGFGERLLQTPDLMWVADRVENILQRFAPTIGC